MGRRALAVGRWALVRRSGLEQVASLRDENLALAEKLVDARERLRYVRRVVQTWRAEGGNDPRLAVIDDWTDSKQPLG